MDIFYQGILGILTLHELAPAPAPAPALALALALARALVLAIARVHELFEILAL